MHQSLPKNGDTAHSADYKRTANVLDFLSQRLRSEFREEHDP